MSTATVFQIALLAHIVNYVFLGGSGLAEVKGLVLLLLGAELVRALLLGSHEVVARGGSEKGAAYASLVRDLIDRGLCGVRLVVSDDHEGIKAAVARELPGVEWQRCVVHFERNVLSHVPASEMGEVAEDLKAIFKVRRERTPRALADSG